MDTFESRVAGIPCQIEVTYYSEDRPMRVTGSGFGDADPPEPEEFEFTVLDRKGYPAPWLERKLTRDDYQRIKQEYLQ
ncbi:hypothetical protein [uncultured Marinobacter sp.]|uniref:hypothetical protein n=1 Tax=uncultured Marinobacter sp. TaxID=187379 RepID=UPI0025938D53|nr:hypothetical protein [uncultured Marinobacter sp.]